MTTASGPPPVPPADIGDLAEQARALLPGEDPLEDEPEAQLGNGLGTGAATLTDAVDPADLLDQQREIGWDDGRDATA